MLCEEHHSTAVAMREKAAYHRMRCEQVENTRRKEAATYQKGQKKLQRRVKNLEETEKTLLERTEVLEKGMEAQDAKIAQLQKRLEQTERVNAKLFERIRCLNKGIEAQEEDLDMQYRRVRYLSALCQILGEDMDQNIKDSEESLRTRIQERLNSLEQ